MVIAIVIVLEIEIVIVIVTEKSRVWQTEHSKQSIERGAEHSKE